MIRRERERQESVWKRKGEVKRKREMERDRS